MLLVAVLLVPGGLWASGHASQTTDNRQLTTNRKQLTTSNQQRLSKRATHNFGMLARSWTSPNSSSP